jgi:hypothetical protein
MGRWARRSFALYFCTCTSGLVPYLLLLCRVICVLSYVSTPIITLSVFLFLFSLSLLLMQVFMLVIILHYIIILLLLINSWVWAQRLSSFIGRYLVSLSCI